MVALEVVTGIELLPITEGSIGGVGSQPPASLSLPIGGSMSKPPTDRDDKKRKKAGIMKVIRKARPSGSSNNSGDDLGADPFDNLDIIRDLIDKFTLLGESGHHILVHLKRIDHQVVEALKVQGDLQAKIDYLRGKVTEVEHLMGEKVVENENLQGVLQKEELILIELKAVLSLEEEKKEAEIKVAELEIRISKSILEVAARAVKELKASFEMKDLNITFN
ncbi:hypothetical protein COCNU_08G000480 [Cocos nucifera]|uniref:Uncharacterized protein n=1 Tax=Cocos nucifera TaxID=13894 RepID=A0A8K0N672_COCNU|nr:hypothetical protein COCNU_08G000480 [Cocos nucifera]